MYNPPYRLLLADAADTFRLGVKQILHHTLGRVTLSEVKTLGELRVALQLLPQTGNPYRDVLLLGTCTESRRAVDIFTALRTVEANATIPIIIMGWLDGGWLIHHLLTRHQHVLGYLHRHDDFSQHLAPALAAVTRSKSYLSPAAQALVSEAQRLGLTNHKFGPDEIAVLRGLARGETRGHIATQLGVPVGQVHTITRRMRRLLDVPSTEVLILRAREWGIC